jgi:hypothetical protein
VISAGGGRRPRADEGVPPVSEERREKGIPFRDCFLLGCGPILVPGQMGSPGPFSYFLFFFCFLISFIVFAKLLQINSNHFQKFSKIQINNTKQ